MKVRYLTQCAIIVAALVPAPLWAKLTVNSSSSPSYWIIRQDIMDNLEAPNPAIRFRMVESSPYGPHPMGNPIHPKVGATFWVFPACGPEQRMKPERRRMVRIENNTVIAVECQ